MARGLVIPTIFTAVDRLSTVVSRMGQNIGGFATKAQAGISRLNNKINSLIPGYNSVKGALMGFVGAAVLAGAIVSGIVFSAQSLIQYEKNIASLRLILNDISASSFKLYQNEIDRVAKVTRTSAVEVAAAASKIAELNIQLAATPKGLGEVATAVVTFSRAADMEMAPAAESLVSVMSQFGLGADQANRTINALAAGLKYGSASITNQVEAYKNFGTVAKTANITLEQSTALVQVLAKYQLKGAEAGTALRGAIIRLQKAGAGYANGQFSINNALDQANKKYNSLATARKKDAFLISLFGIRQITAGKILLNNVGLYQKLTKQVTGTNEAFIQADIRMDTVAGRWEQLKAGLVNYLTSNDNAREGMKKLKQAIVYVTDNLDKIIDTIGTAIKWFLYYKVAIKSLQLAFFLISNGMKLYTFLTGLSTAATVAATTATAAQTVVVGGFGTALAGVTTELEVANTAAAGFFATLSGFAIPAALTALGGLAIWKVLDENSKERAYGDSLTKKTYFDPKTAIGKISPFSNTKEESDYQKWFVSMAKAGTNKNLLERTNFDQQFANNYPKYDLSTPILNKPPVQFTQSHSTATTNNTLDINISDPGKAVKDTSMRGALSIPVRMTPTTGNK